MIGSQPLVTYEHRSWYTNSEAGFRDKYPFVQPGFPVGTIFFGTKGYLIFPDYSSYLRAEVRTRSQRGGAWTPDGGSASLPELDRGHSESKA